VRVNPSRLAAATLAALIFATANGWPAHPPDAAARMAAITVADPSRSAPAPFSQYLPNLAARSAAAAIAGFPTVPSTSRRRQETAGVRTPTFTNYNNAGGRRGRTIRRYQTVWISCRLRGFKVRDGDTWWYRIASRPWHYRYYASADDFYNNGWKTGNLRHTPFVDRKVRICTRR
jgi:hypothetical protein